MDSIKIRVLVFRDATSNIWFAQGLEHDICAQAKTIDEVHTAFEKAILANAAVALERGEEPLAAIPKAPAAFFRAFRDATVQSDFARPRRKQQASRTSDWRPIQPVFRVTERLTAAS
jgi:hypothetical protein